MTEHPASSTAGSERVSHWPTRRRLHPAGAFVAPELPLLPLLPIIICLPLP
jgi:hypothetical protein